MFPPKVDPPLADNFQTFGNLVIAHFASLAESRRSEAKARRENSLEIGNLFEPFSHFLITYLFTIHYYLPFLPGSRRQSEQFFY